MYNENLFVNSEIITQLNKIVQPYAPEGFEGNCLYQHASNFIIDKTKNILRQNLYNISKDAGSIIEIGINGGHSIALFLYSNPNLEILGFDICQHPYTRPCCNFLSGKYNFTLIEGDTTHTLEDYTTNVKYDIIHIDGGHTTNDLMQNVYDCKKFAHADTIIIIDDIPGNRDVYQGVINMRENNTIEDITENLLMDRNTRIMNCSYHRFFTYNGL